MLHQQGKGKLNVILQVQLKDLLIEEMKGVRQNSMLRL